MRRAPLLVVLSLALTGCFSLGERTERENGPTPGSAGADGTTGATGPAGSTGADGQSGAVSRADTYTVIGDWRKFGPGELQSASASCARAEDAIVTGGCMVAASGGEAAIASSAPLVPEKASEPAYWSCSAKNIGDMPAEMVAIVICARGQ